MTMLIGHRGAAGTTPENTMVSFLRAKELGAQGIEFDLHRTKDGHLVVIHDFHLNRTTSGTGMIREKTLAELKAVDAGAWFGAQYAGERIPTLVELIEAYPDQLFLEMKAGSIGYPGIEEDVLRLLHETGALPRTQVSSFDHHSLLRLRQLEPKLETGMLHACNLLDPVGMARAAGCTALHPNYGWVTPAYVKAAHDAGLQVNVWTVNSKEDIERMKFLGVDGIMTDFPERF